ncbi:hypothetical protein [Natronococcus wangiae]|uniref:hypothetical protein n=1 Tax=Natronococcus wangiae TaxID=3068275 RepID=UPI00273D080C|nr:hypothetical protein [Natronococcus sp. AD5]
MVDAGADPEGNESASPVIQDEIDDDTLLKFPEGEYYMDEQVRFTSFENVGIVSEDGAEVTLVPANYHEFDGPPRLFRLGTSENPGRDLHFEGFYVDQTAEDTGIRVINAEVEDGLYVGSVFIHGEHDSGTWGPGLFNVVDSNGEGVVECFRAFDGGVFSDETPNSGTVRRGSSGIHVNGNHRGTLTFKSCVLGGFAGTGLYASSNGRVDVEGGWYENSVTGSLRMGVSEGRIEDAVAVVDDPIEDREVLQHPIRLDHGDRIEVENVTINTPDPNGNALRVMEGVDEATISDTKIAVGGDSTAVRIDEGAGSTTFENVELEMNGDAYAFRILGDDAGAVALRNVDVTGDASGSPVPPAIFCTRNDCDFESLSVDQPGDEGRRGIELRGENYVVADSEFDTTGVPITVHNADDVRIENTYAQAYEDSYSLRIFDDSGTVNLENNEFPDGVDDRR